jgi:hypothetical protein
MSTTPPLASTNQQLLQKQCPKRESDTDAPHRSIQKIQI